MRALVARSAVRGWTVSMPFDDAVDKLLGHGWSLLHLSGEDLTEANGSANRTTIAVLGNLGSDSRPRDLQ